MFDFTIRAFNLSEYYRLPVILLADETIGTHDRTRGGSPEEEIEIVNRRKPAVIPEEYLPYEADPRRQSRRWPTAATDTGSRHRSDARRARLSGNG